MLLWSYSGDTLERVSTIKSIVETSYPIRPMAIAMASLSLYWLSFSYFFFSFLTAPMNSSKMLQDWNFDSTCWSQLATSNLVDVTGIYGDLFLFQILQQDVVVINELNLIKEALNNNSISGRPFIFRYENNIHRHYYITYHVQLYDMYDVILDTFDQKR